MKHFRPSPDAIVGRYLLRRRLGAGGMGEVWLARDRQLGRPVALKLFVDAGADALGEARLTARLSHPHVVTIHEVGEDPPFLALELLPGGTLRERLDAGPLALPEALRIAAMMADGLGAAHAAGVLHLDLKPENVLFGPTGEAKLADFGLARAAGAVEGRPSGTPAYFAPERWRGDPVGPAADLWSFGVVLHELVFGRRPYGPAEAGSLRTLGAAVQQPARLEDHDLLPGPLADLVRALLDPDPAVRPDAVGLLARLRAAQAGRGQVEGCPFRGLEAFDTEHAAAFFGRDVEIGRVVARLGTRPTLTIVGGSGVGKSSLVRAGVIPRMGEQRRLRVVVLRPGRDPVQALADALQGARGDGAQTTVELDGADPWVSVDAPGPDLADAIRASPARVAVELLAICQDRDTDVLLVVDQLEEALTQAPPDDRRVFVRAVYSAATDPDERVRTVVTLRHEFLGRLGQALGDVPLGEFLVLHPPSPDALEDALRRAVASAGHTWDDDDLPAAIAAGVAGRAGSLALVQFVGQQLWARRDREGRRLLRTAYDALGGVAGALARHADDVLAGMTADQVAVARQLLLRLTTEEGTRRGLPVDDAVAGLAVGPVLDRLIDARLVTTLATADGPTVELVHECLLTTWDRLAGWVRDSRAQLRVAAALDDAAALWDRRGRPADALWRDEPLAEATLVLRGAPEVLTGRAAALLEASTEAARAAERRVTWLRRASLGGALVLAIASLAAAAAYQAQSERAEVAADEARRSEAMALARSARLAWTSGDRHAALAQLRSSLTAVDTREARALWAQVRTAPLRWTLPVDAGVYAIGAGDDHTVWLGTGAGAMAVDTRTREVTVATSGLTADIEVVGGDCWTHDFENLWRWPGCGAERRPVPLPDGMTPMHLVGGPHPLALTIPPVHLVDLGVSPPTATPLPARHLRAVVTPDGREVISLGRDGDSQRAGRGGEAGPPLAPGPAAPTWLTVSPDGRYLAAAGSDVRVWRLADGEVVHRLAGPTASVRGGGFAADGSQLAVVTESGRVRVWSLPDEHVHDLALDDGLSGRVLGATRARHTPALAVARESGLAWVRLDTLAAAPRTGHEDWSAAVWVDEAEVVAGGRDGVLRVWDRATGEERQVLHGHDLGITAVARHGDHWVTGSDDHTVRRWDRVTGGRSLPLVHPEPVVWVGGTGTLRTATWRGFVRTWDVRPAGADPTPARLSTGIVQDNLSAVAVLPGGDLLLGGIRGGVYRLRGEAADRVAVLSGGVGTVATAAGRVLLGGYAGSVRVGPIDGPFADVASDHAPVGSGDLHPDGVRTAYPTATGAILRDTASGQAVPLVGHRAAVANARFSEDGEVVATTSDDGTVRLWDATTGAPRWVGRGLLPDGTALTHRGWIGPAADAPWRTALADAAVAFTGDGPLCVQTADGVARWPVGADAGVAVVRDGVTAVASAPGGCVSLAADGAVWHADTDRAFSDATALDDGVVLGDGRVWWLGADGPTEHVVDGAPVAAAVVAGARYVGYADGRVVAVDTGRALALDGAPALPVTHLGPGPDDTLAVGFADGTHGLWHPTLALPLLAHHRHGAVIAMRVRGDRLHVLTDLGDSAVHDLGVLTAPRCDLLARVTAETHVAWRDGAVVVAEGLPADHPCASR